MVKITDKLLNTIGTSGALVAAFFLSTPRYIYGMTGLVASAAALGLYL